MKFIAIIPARYASTRFPGKPLQLIHGKPMIQHVFDRVKKSRLFDKTIVATDDERIQNAVENFGGEAIMTSLYHQSGTERCAEAIEKIEVNYDVVVNVQGDEPFIEFEQLKMLCNCFKNQNIEIATLIKKITHEDELFNPNTVKCVAGKSGKALYFSRSPIPYCRDKPASEWLLSSDYFKHIGIYGFRTDVLKQLVKLPAGDLEKAESLEQLRWMANGFSIHAAITQLETISIDTPEDLLKIK